MQEDILFLTERYWKFEPRNMALSAA